MAPFAHWGFLWAKIFNTVLSCITIWFTYLIARDLKYKWALAVFPIALFFKLFMCATFSGLTEPLADAMIAITVYLAFRGRFIPASIIISFLPFVRSEGLFICGTFGLYLLAMRQWKIIPLLLLGHIIYSIIGYPYYKDFLWVFHAIPYAHYNDHYGHGPWLYFFHSMPEITGVVNCILLVSGILLISISCIYHIIKRESNQIPVKALFLLILFMVFFMMHTTFWALGIFASFGLTRVFMAIACVMILIMVTAIEYTNNLLSKWLPYHNYIVIIILTIAFPLYGFCLYKYTYTKYDFTLYADQVAAEKMANYIKKNYPDYKKYQIYADASYLYLTLDLDPFALHRDHTNSLYPGDNYHPHSMIIWDGWYSGFEAGIHIDTLRNNKTLKEISHFETQGRWGDKYNVVLFMRE